MKYELRHYAYKPTVGGKSVPANKTINDLGEDAVNYIGTFSKWNPIGHQDGIFVTVKKQTDSIYPKSNLKLSGFKLKHSGSYTNINQGVKFTKQDLLAIAHAMDHDDELHILIPTSDNYDTD